MEGDNKEKERSKPGTVMRVVHRDEDGRRHFEKVAVPETRRPDALRYVERKLCEKGLHRMERHPVDGRTLLAHGPRKSGHGGKYTWEGPIDLAEAELDPAPAAIDEGDPNYEGPSEELQGQGQGATGDDEEGGEAEGEDTASGGHRGLVVGEVEVAKVAEARDGVSRIEVLPPLQP